MHDAQSPTAGVMDLDDLAVDALLMSAAWRTAGLELLRGAREGWETHDLARWLIGSYREATSHVARESAWCARGSVDAARVRDVLVDACAAVIGCLREASWAEAPDFVRRAMHDGDVVAASHGFWVPLDRPRMRLERRVLSLFAADYLLSAHDYAVSLAVCSKCDAVVFDPAARQTGHCGADRISDFVQVLRRPSSHESAAARARA